MEISENGAFSHESDTEEDPITNPDAAIPKEGGPSGDTPEQYAETDLTAADDTVGDTTCQGTRWCYTSFLDDQNPLFNPHECRYFIEGKEIAPTTGKKHIQGFVWFHKNMRFSALKKRYPKGVRFMLCRGNPYQNFVYCSKDGDFIEHGARPKPTKKTADVNTPYKLALEAATVKEGLDIIKRDRARDFCLYGEVIERQLKKAKFPPFCALFKPSDFCVPLIPEVQVHLFTGPSGIGKTQYAIAHFSKPLVCSHLDDLRRLSPDHDGIVFDDMSFRHMPVEFVIHLLDWDLERSLHVRWGTVTIPSKTKKIFTHNNINPFYDTIIINSYQKEAITRRLTTHLFKDKLFNDDI